MRITIAFLVVELLATAPILTSLFSLQSQQVRGQEVDGGREETLHDRLQTIDRSDGAALLELGRWCQENQRATWAAKCYQRALDLDDDRVESEAMFRLASVELEQGRYESAYKRLRSLASKHDHSGAKSLLRQASSRITEKQRALFARGKKAYGAKDWEEARKLLTQAYALGPDGPTKANFVPNRNILLGLSRTVSKIDDDFYRQKVRPIERSVVSCKRKTCDGGFEKCNACDGKGGRIRRFARGNRTEKCADCAGLGRHFCASCIGLEFTTDDDKLTDKERKVFLDVIMKVRSIKFLKSGLEKALREVESLVLGVDQSATLRYFRSGKAKYTLSRSLRDRLKTVPPEKTQLKDAAAKWKKEERLTVRANFLLSYLCEFSQHVEGFDMLRGSPRNLSLSAVPPLEAPAMSPVAPEILSAFPDTQKPSWIYVEGLFKQYREDAKEPERGRLEIHGEVSHDVNFFVWRPEAIPHLQHLERGRWKSLARGLSKAYPFDIREKLRNAPEDHKMILVGRFLRDRLGYPRNWFEIWDVKVGLSSTQEKMYLALRESADIAFPPVEARRLGRFMRWYGLTVEFDDVDQNVPVSCRANGRPLGYLLNEIAKGMKVDWYLRDSKVVFTNRTSRNRARDMTKVLALLSENGTGDVVVHVGGRSALGRGSATGRRALPSDPAALARLAIQAMTKMDYRTAGDCYQRLLAAKPAPDRKKELETERFRARLFGAITGKTPISHLARGEDLMRITYNSGNRRVTRVVKKLGEDGDSVSIQTSYGAEIKLASEGVLKKEPISREDWHRAKKRALEERVREVADAEGRERVTGLLSLALYAKTNMFWSQGTGYLDELVSRDDFGWLIETYFPSRAELLVRDWRSLTGRKTPGAGRDPGAGRGRSGSDPNERPKLAEELPRDPGELMSFGRKHFARGRAFLSRSLPGMENASENRKQAHTHFTLTVDAMKRYLRHKPDDDDAKALRRESTLMVQTCAKDMGFFD